MQQYINNVSIHEELKSNNSLSVPSNILHINNTKSLSDSINIHLELLYSNAIQEKLNGHINIKFMTNEKILKKEIKDIHVQELHSRKSEIINYIVNEYNTCNAYILPNITKDGSALKNKIMGGEVLLLEFDKGNTEKILESIIDKFGIPTLVVSSGGITEIGFNKLHIYYKFDRFIFGDDFKKLLEIQALIIRHFKADEQYINNPSQMIRIIGSINQKNGNNKRYCVIESNNIDLKYDFNRFYNTVIAYFEENQSIEDGIDSVNVFQLADSKITSAQVEITLAKYDIERLIQLNGELEYGLWRDVIFAIAYNFDKNDIGYKLALEWSLKDQTRQREEIEKSVRHYYYDKAREDFKNPLTFKTIIKRANELQDIYDNVEFVKNHGRPVEITNITEKEKYVLTVNKLLYIKQTQKSYKEIILCNYIKLLGYHPSNTDGSLYIEIETKNFKGELIKSAIQPSLKSDDLLAVLQDKELCVDTINFSLLRRYISIYKSDKEISVINKSGWNSINWESYTNKNNWDKKGFFALLYPHKVESYYVQNTLENINTYLSFKPNNTKDLVDVRGTFKGWQDNICRYAVNNDAVSFTLFLSFSTIFYTPTRTRSCIYHLYGESSKGKSVLLDIAMSSQGFALSDGNTNGHGYTTWNSTIVGFEGLCAAKNDLLLCIDDLTPQTDAKVAADAAYLIVQGEGRNRGHSKGSNFGNRTTKNWKTPCLSTGEIPFKVKLNEDKREIMGGVEVRVLDIPIVNYKYGIFNDLHRFNNSYDLVKHFEIETANYKGLAFKEFLMYVINQNNFSDVLVEFKKLKDLWLDKHFETIQDINQNQLRASVDNLAFVAAAGELAIKAKIFGDYFKEGDAFKVVKNIFHIYLETIGDYSLTSEERKILRKMKNFLQQRIDTTFYSEKDSKYSPQDGWFGLNDKGDFYVLSSRLEDICGQGNKTKIIETLKRKKYIRKFKNGSYTDSKRFKPYGDIKNNRPSFYFLDLKEIGLTSIIDENPDDETSDDPDPNDPKGGGKSKSETEPLSIDEHISTTDIEPSKDNIVIDNTTINYELQDRHNLIEFLQKSEKSITYGLDIETTGLNARNSEIALIQIYNPNLDKVFIYKVFDSPLTKEEKKLLADIRFVAHNASFERSFMSYLKHLDCSMIAYHAATSKRRCSIGDLSVYTGIVYNNKKVMQTSDWRGELTEEQLEYAANDAKATYILWQKYKDLNIPVYDRMYKASFIIDDYARRGLPVDMEALRNLRIEKENKRDELLKKLNALGFADVITPNNNIRTKKEVMDKVTPDVMKIVEEVRRTNSLINNIIKGVEENIVDGRLPINVLICGTETGRLSTVNPNVQNFPRSGFRHIFKAREGYRFVRADFSGQELRMVAAMSNEKVLIEAFNNGKDPHAIMAARLNNIPLKTFLEQPKDWQKSERQKAKAANFGFLYGMGASRFIVNAKEAYNVDLTLEEATTIKNKFWATYSFLKKWSEKEREECKTRGYALTRGGRKRRFEDIENAYCEMINTAVQGSCGEVLLETLIALPDYLKGYLVNTVHDELIFEVPIELIKDEAKYTELKNHIIDAMIMGVSKVEKRYPTLNITEIKDTERL